MSNSLLTRMFMTPHYFTIAICKRQKESIIDRKRFAPEYIIPATRPSWCADPMLAENEGKTYLFYEAMHNDHGRIEVVEIFDDCTVGKPTVVLEDECHYSYPFVFSREGVFYMIPESSAANEVRLYKAKRFPYEWEQCCVLLNARAVDTTVFESGGRMYLLTFIIEETEAVKPQAYEFCFEDGYKLKMLKWGEFDPLRVRGAGGVLKCSDRLIRPAQVSTEIRYGDAVTFYEVCVDENGYSEKPVAELLHDDISARGVIMDGLHTYSASERFEVIDIRCREFDLLKVPRRIFGV